MQWEILPTYSFKLSSQESPLPRKQVSTVFEELNIHFIDHKKIYTISEVTILTIFHVKTFYKRILNKKERILVKKNSEIHNQILRIPSDRKRVEKNRKHKNKLTNCLNLSGLAIQITVLTTRMIWKFQKESFKYMRQWYSKWNHIKKKIFAWATIMKKRNRAVSNTGNE